jgi:dipeptidyl aminopeptidase/acylaminoacyl peptidase
LSFTWNRDGHGEVWIVPSDLSEPAHRILRRERGVTEVEWSPDGEVLVFATDPEDAREGDIMAIRAEGIDPIPMERAPLPLAIQPEAKEWHPRVSPDGQWLAYLSDETGAAELWVMPFPDPGGQRWRLSDLDRPVRNFAWAHSGRDLFYQVSTRLRAIRVDAGTPPSAWEDREVAPFIYPAWDIGEDNQFFLVISQINLPWEDINDPAQLIRIENFPEYLEYLKRRQEG